MRGGDTHPQESVFNKMQTHTGHQYTSYEKAFIYFFASGALCGEILVIIKHTDIPWVI